MRNLKMLFAKLLFVSSLVLANQAFAQSIKVVTSIPPLAMMVAPLLSDQDQIEVLLTPGATPHGFQMKPSHLKALSSADLVVSVGTGVDGWLAKSLANHQGAKVSMFAQPDLVLLQKRSGGAWEEHEHHGHNHQQNLARMDGHIWLSLTNAKLLIQGVSKELQKNYPSRAGEFAARETAVLDSLNARNQAWLEQLAPLSERKFIVMHDAYQYFEQAFGLQAVGTIHTNPELPPSAKLLQQLRQKVQQENLACVFAEPQFPVSRLDALTKGLAVNKGKMDPLGDFEQTKTFEAFYDQLIQNFVQCVGDE